MPKELKRYYGRVSAFSHVQLLSPLPPLKTMRARSLFVLVLRKIRERYKFLLVGYVVMPNHMHLLISETSSHTIPRAEGVEAVDFQRFPSRPAPGSERTITLRVCDKRCGESDAFLAAAVKPTCGAPRVAGRQCFQKDMGICYEMGTAGTRRLVSGQQ